VAQGLVERFPEGVFFVPLAAVTTSDVMWTSIAEVLDVPPEGRIPPGFFDHVAHRTALLVLDNLEQVAGADEVVVELLQEASQVVVVATSRRPLNVPGELQHAVPPLELPDGDDLATAADSGAVQLFAQTARSVRSGFAVTADNVGDVVAICSRLDGLPLAIELAAARSKLLAPHALLARLDKALDLRASGVGRPSRQRTLRDTIAWSYDLLEPRQQVLFRRLGVFAGGADLDAIEAVCGELLDGEDLLDVIAELVDASLATIGESIDGEPRAGMLVTVRAFALDRLDAAGETAAARAAHATHFAVMGDTLRTDKEGPRQPAALQRFDLEVDNFREALAYAFGAGDETASPQRVALGRRLCRSLGWCWISRGYLGEGRRWLEQSVALEEDRDSLDLAYNLAQLANSLSMQGAYQSSQQVAEASLGICRRHDDGGEELIYGLSGLAWALHDLGDNDGARRTFEEAVEKARRNGDVYLLSRAISDLGGFEHTCGNLGRAQELTVEALGLAKQLGDPLGTVLLEANLAGTAVESGDVDRAQELFEGIVSQVLRLGDPGLIVGIADNYADVLVKGENPAAAACLLGACSATRERMGMPRYPAEQAETTKLVEAITAALPIGEFERQYEGGRTRAIEDVLGELGHR
jgi:predicted ATPase